MTDIVYTGGASPNKSGSGFGDTIKELLPVVVLAGLGYLAYVLLMSPGNQAAQGATGQQQGYGNMNPNSQGTTSQQQGPGYNPGGNNQAPAVAQVGSISAQARAILNTPGTYSTYPGGPAYQGSGLGGLFVEAGPMTPTNFFPIGNVVTASRQLSVQEQAKVLLNLQNSGITNAWWTPPTITQTSNPGGVNSGGSYQSNIPQGTKHCKCPYPGCGPNDDWTYC